MKWMIVLIFLASCSSQPTNPSNQYRTDENRPLVDGKYSLTADRKALDEVRAQIPQEIQTKNDELALIDNFFVDPKKNPSDIKNNFDRLVQKKRELFERDSKKERETFTKSERKSRDEFLKSQKQKRDELLKSKPGQEQRKEFFTQQDEKRQEFFQNEREKRGDFESDLRERRKSFDDYLRERQATFLQQWRVFKSNQDIENKKNGN